jgi:hypothetical protein
VAAAAAEATVSALWKGKRASSCVRSRKLHPPVAVRRWNTLWSTTLAPALSRGEPSWPLVPLGLFLSHGP